MPQTKQFHETRHAPGLTKSQLQCLVGTSRGNFVKIKLWIFSILLIGEILVRCITNGYGYSKLQFGKTNLLYTSNMEAYNNLPTINEWMTNFQSLFWVLLKIIYIPQWCLLVLHWWALVESEVSQMITRTSLTIMVLTSLSCVHTHIDTQTRWQTDRQTHNADTHTHIYKHTHTHTHTHTQYTHTQ